MEDKELQGEDLEKAKQIMEAQLEADKENLRSMINKILLSTQNEVQYNNRLVKICNIIRERLNESTDAEKILQSSDIYQKIEVFMNYDYEIDENTGQKVITSDIYTLIGEVFKSLYVNFILSYLERERSFPLPYIGKIWIIKWRKFHPISKRVVEALVGKLALDKDLRNDLKKIEKKARIGIIDDILDETRKNLMDKAL